MLHNSWQCGIVLVCAEDPDEIATSRPQRNQTLLARREAARVVLASSLCPSDGLGHGADEFHKSFIVPQHSALTTRRCVSNQPIPWQIEACLLLWNCLEIRLKIWGMRRLCHGIRTSSEAGRGLMAGKCSDSNQILPQQTFTLPAANITIQGKFQALK